MPTCSVPYCTNASNKDSDLTFHEFPHETSLFLNTWLKKIGRPNWRPGLRSVVCSKHFVKDDFDRSGKLRVGSFPSLFPLPPSRKKKKIMPTQAADVDTNLNDKTSLETPHQRMKGSSVIFQPVLKLEDLEPQVIIKIENVEFDSSKNKNISKTANSSSTVELNSENSPLVPNAKSSLSIDDERAAKSSVIETNSVSANSSTEANASATSLGPKSKTSPESPVKESNDKSTLKRKRNESGESASTSVSSVNFSFSLLSCRICGLTSSLNTPIFGKEGLRIDLPGLINKHLPIKVSQTDSLPLNICDGCISHLKVCQDIITKCGQTNDRLNGKPPQPQELTDINSPHVSSSQLKDSTQGIGNISKHQKSLDSLGDALVVHKQTITRKPTSASEMSRILLLEMPCTEQVPVKSMINQAIEELTLRLLPKDSRKCKPHGRIMFLDLQGGRAAYPEQMSKAVAMMFANGAAEVKNKKVVLPAQAGASTPVLAPSKSAQSPSIVPSLVKLAPSKASSLQGTPLVPSLPVTMPTAIQISLPPVSLSSPMTCTTLPHSNLKTVLTLPPGQSFPSLFHMPAESAPLQLQAQYSNGIETALPQNFPCLVPVSVSNTKNLNVQNIPSLVSFKESENTDTFKKSPVDVSGTREKMLTKISNKGKQFKLGDKIVGIVLRNSQSSEEIQKKLQATFSKPAILSKPTDKQKERPIAPKGSERISSAPTTLIETTVVCDFGENVRKPKEPVFDICSSPDALCSYNERRTSFKPSLGFMWQKTSYLASSYQKLFTWVPPFGPGTMPVLSCRVCSRTVSNRSEVENHIQSHPELQCSICQKYFLTIDKVQEHVKVIHLLAPYEMPKKKTFISWRQNALRRHALKQYQCSRCEKRYKQREALERHSIVCKQKTLAEKVVAISNANLLSCPVCNKTMSSNAALQDHMLVHTKRTSWLCDICGLVLKTQSNYRAHTARHEELAHQFKYQCKVCKKRFKLLNRFTEHEKSHEIQRQYICPSCGKVFRTLNGLRQHEILHGERKLQCRFCPSRFHRRDHLRIHEACHNKSPNKSRMPRNFRCRFCPVSEDSARFPNMKQLMGHYAEIHDLERGKIPGSHKYSCDRCPRTFINSTLLRHHYMWHDGERPYHCSICGQGFMVKERLRNHENIHTNERPHKCPQCGKGFRSRHVLKQHKKVHSDPSTHFRCRYCQKGFSRVDNLRTHELVHTGVKPWKCVICLRQYRIRADCAKHISNNHQLSPADVQLNIVNATEEASTSNQGLIDGDVKTIGSVDTIEFLLEEEELEEEEEAIE